MGERVWNCPKCGKVADPLYGEDDKFHCSGLDCDEIVRILTDDDIAKPTLEEHRKALGRGTFIRDTFPRRKKTTSSSPTNGLSGPEIMRRMAARNKAHQAHRKGEKVRRPNVVKKNDSSRHGLCSVCDQDKWLLSMDPVNLCAGCFRAENPPDHSGDAAVKRAKKSKAKKAPVKEGLAKKKTRRAPKPKAPVVKRKTRRAQVAKRPKRRASDDNLSQEVQAIEDVCRAIDQLTPKEIERVLRFSLSRYQDTYGMPVMGPLVSEMPVLEG